MPGNSSDTLTNGQHTMNYELTSPCGSCPFRINSKAGWLGEERAADIIGSLFGGGEFSCHKLNDSDGEGGRVEGDKSQFCAGALILLEKLEQPNQMMRICHRLGLYDRRKLAMDAPVFDDDQDFIEHHGIAS